MAVVNMRGSTITVDGQVQFVSETFAFEMLETCYKNTVIRDIVNNTKMDITAGTPVHIHADRLDALAYLTATTNPMNNQPTFLQQLIGLYMMSMVAEELD